MSISPPRGQSPGPKVKNAGQTEHCTTLSKARERKEVKWMTNAKRNVHGIEEHERAEVQQFV